MLSASTLWSQTKDKIEGVWYNQEKTAKIRIYKATNGKFYGAIIWLKEPNRNGKPKMDDNNPNAAKRHQPLLNLLVLKGFEKEDDNRYEDGTIYDPKNGKTYSCKMTYKGNTLNVRGYIGISLIGRTAIWERTE
jgi:uncharacterized protein (DUF2147 family)